MAGLVIDEDNPCEAAKALRAVYYRLIAGQAPMTVTFRAGPNGVERSTTFNKADPERLSAGDPGLRGASARRRPAGAPPVCRARRRQTMNPEDLQSVMPAADGPTLAHIASALLDQPLLLHPTKAEVVLHVLQNRLGFDSGGGIAPLSPDASRFIGTLPARERQLWPLAGNKGGGDHLGRRRAGEPRARGSAPDPASSPTRAWRRRSATR